LLPTTLVEERRAELAPPPGREFLRRTLEFEALSPDEAAVPRDLPDDFVAVSFDEAAEHEGLAASATAQLAADGPVVVLNPTGGADAGAIVVRGGRDVELRRAGPRSGVRRELGPVGGRSGAPGRPAVAFDAGTASPEDLRLAGAFLPGFESSASISRRSTR
jgi:hypothetical protein